MIYFSEVDNKKVYTQDQRYVGRLSDLIFTATDKPYVTKLYVRDQNKKRILVDVKDLIKINSYIVLKNNYEVVSLSENELFVMRNLLDKQIIDIEGHKIVRVNDVLIQNKPTLYISGVDTGVRGILRWIKLEEIVTDIFRLIRFNPPPKILSWADIQPLELSRGRVKMKKKVEKLDRVRPEDLADYLERTNIVNTKKILNILDADFAAEVVGNMNINYQTMLFKQFSSEKAAQIISSIDPDEGVDILFTITPQKRDEIIKLLPDEKKKEINYLLGLAKTPIGNLISPDYLTCYSDETVRQIITKIRANSSDFSELSYVYFLNKQNQLVGVCSLHELMLQDWETPAFRFMLQDVIVIHLTTPEEIAINKMLKYKLYALPVIDNEKQMIGVVKLDNLTGFILKKI